MDQLLGDAKRLVQRLSCHDNSVEILISDAENLQNRLIAMRQYKDEVSKLNDIADHRPRSTLILGSQLENQRIQSLEQENRELSISLAEHQSALELIMNKYREHVLLMMKPTSIDMSGLSKNCDQSNEMVFMKERIAEMARVMWESAAIDDSAQIKEIEFVRRLQVENQYLRELLEISGEKLCKDTSQNMESFSHKESLTSPIHSSMLPNKTTANFLKNDKINNVKDSECISDNTAGVKNYEPDDMFDIFSINKHKKRYGSKESRIFGNMRLPFDLDGGEDNVDSSDISNKEHIKNLQGLFIEPNSRNDKETSSDSSLMPATGDAPNTDSDNYYLSMDPSENCFRAIISDIKPLDFNIDMNENLFPQENVSSLQSDGTELFLDDTNNLSLEDTNEGESTAVVEGKDIDDIVESAKYVEKSSDISDDNGDPVTSDIIHGFQVPAYASDKFDIDDTIINNEVQSDTEILNGSNASDKFDIHDTTINNEVKSDTEILNGSNGSDKFDIHDTTINNEVQSDTEILNGSNALDKFDVHDTTINNEVKSDTEILNGSNADNDELDALNSLDEMLEFESDDDNEIIIDNIHTATIDANVLEMQNSVKSTPFPVDTDVDVSEQDSNNLKDNADVEVQKVIHLNVNDSKINSIAECADDIQAQKLNTLSSDKDYSIKKDIPLEYDKHIAEIRTENVVIDGDISDNDSEITYTAEDIDEALFDLDSLLDANEEDDLN